MTPQTENDRSGDTHKAEPAKPLLSRIGLIVFGKPRDLADHSIFHRLALMPFLAWVGLGSDGLSSSSYGPQEAFLTLGTHTYLALPLALMTGATVFLISAAYARIIEEFPLGGGGYNVGTKLLGRNAGLVSGCALLVDYVLTITVSIAAAGDALFSFLPLGWHGWKIPVEAGMIIGLSILNIRGVRESVLTLAPIFLVFVVTHLIVILGGIVGHAGQVGETVSQLGSSMRSGLGTLGMGGMVLLLFHAYSLGGGTYTGLEAVSNGLPIMREPRVFTARRTMQYMSVSLAFTAAGLLFCYLLWDVRYTEGMTTNAVLLQNMMGSSALGEAFGIITLLSEGAILIVGAQTGFLGGPRVLSNMALDGWAPRRFAALSERLTTRNGILLMGGTALVALVYTSGNVSHLVVMYSINVFLTFSLSMLGMARLRFRTRKESPMWKRRLALFLVGLVLCSTILVITILVKFGSGGWVTLVVTGLLIALCQAIRAHYKNVGIKLAKLYSLLEQSSYDEPGGSKALKLDSSKPTAAFLVAQFGGLGIHTLLNGLRAFPGHFKNLVFVSVAVVDSGDLNETDAVRAIKERTQKNLEKYVHLAHSLGMPATYRMDAGTDAVDAAEKLCLSLTREFPHTTFFAGKLMFDRPRWYHRLLHNETAFAIERRLQQAGKTMVILPARVE